jgi:hypothetical protein
MPNITVFLLDIIDGNSLHRPVKELHQDNGISNQINHSRVGDDTPAKRECWRRIDCARRIAIACGEAPAERCLRGVYLEVLLAESGEVLELRLEAIDQDSGRIASCRDPDPDAEEEDLSGDV